MIADYIEGLNTTHNCIMSGIAWFMNYMPEHEGIMTSKYAIENHDNFPIIKTGEFKVNWYITRGEQIFTDYGSTWFKDNGFLEPLQPRRANIPNFLKLSNLQAFYDDTKTLPGCSSIFTTFDIANHILKAAVKIRKNEVIETTRVLLFNDDSDDYLEQPISKYIWRNFDYNPEKQYGDSDYWRNLPINRIMFTSFNATARYSMLAIGNGLLYSGILKQPTVINISSRSSSGGGEEAGVGGDDTFYTEENVRSFVPRISLREPNVRYSWFDFRDELKSPCPVGFKCTSKGVVCKALMMLSFTASRDIKTGEELIIPLYVDPKTGLRFVGPELTYPCLSPDVDSNRKRRSLSAQEL